MQPWAVALIRGLVGGVTLGGAAFFGALASGQPTRAALIQAGVAFFGYLVLRAGAEGIIDQQASKP